MLDNGFIGRDQEIERLERCMESKQAQMVVIYGRRRVGKTFLVETVFDNQFAFSFTGAYQQPRVVQLRNFADEMRFQTGTDAGVPYSWRDAFVILRSYLNSLNNDRKQVVFFDELPWMDTRGSDFLPSFEWFWNSWGSKQSNLVMIVCGSATSWMMKNISDNKGGLFYRQTCRIYLEPFNLNETERFLLSREIRWARYEIAECYMIMGGMPYYLNLLDPSASFRQNIDKLFFKKRGELWDEFNHLYHTLFTNGESYIEVAELLSRKNGGLTRKELSEQTTITSSGSLSRILEDLTASGFVRIYHYFGRSKREAVYQLCDYYSLFYFHFIRENYGKDEEFWSKSFDNPKRRTWCGLTFEQLCKDHIRQIKRALGISGVVTEESAWFIRSKENAKQGDRRTPVSRTSESAFREEEVSRGAQIDMLIDRRDMSVNICEMKYSMNEFEIDKDYDRILRNMIEAFRKSTGTRKSLILTMITTFGVKKNKYSGIVNSHVVLDDLFEAAD